MENHTQEYGLKMKTRINTKKQNMVGYLEVRLRVTERSSFSIFRPLVNHFRMSIMYVSEVLEDSVMNIVLV